MWPLFDAGYVIALCREPFDPEVMNAALDWFSVQVGQLDATAPLAFVGAIPRLRRCPKAWPLPRNRWSTHPAAAFGATRGDYQSRLPLFEELFEDRTGASAAEAGNAGPCFPGC